MKVSIITVCYNSASTIRDTIESVVGQDYSDIEYIIVDGKSTDDTLAILNSYSGKINKIISEPDNGLYDAINKGIRAASGEIIGLIHADDVLASSHVIDRITEVFKLNKCDAVYSDLQYVDKDDMSKVFRDWKAGEYKTGMFLEGWMPPHPTLYVKRKLFAEFGYYNTSFKISADYELMLRFIHRNNIQIKYIPEVHVKMRVGGKSNSSVFNRVKANIEDRKAWKINKLKPNFLTLYSKPLSKLAQFLK
ncbi:MAG: glycosyltransferase [Flavobacteriales bacterium]|nr:glycosyltransferase [Flavobacteriales bacterium]